MGLNLDFKLRLGSSTSFVTNIWLIFKDPQLLLSLILFKVKKLLLLLLVMLRLIYIIFF